MSKPSDFDIGPLTWVKGEIDQALERSQAALRAYAAAPQDATTLRACRTHFHQAHGALQIIGLDGVTRLSEEVESLLADIGDGEAPGAQAIEAVERAYAAMRAYLEGLLAGEANQPLKLLEVYAAVCAARGRQADPIDLYYPDLSHRPPRRERPTVPVGAADAERFYRRQRARYQRGLLRWLRKDSAGIGDMRLAVAAVEAAQISPAQRAFWWVALGVFDALAGGQLAQARVQRLCNRIEQQLKRLLEGSTTVAERLMREALYSVAGAAPVTDHLRLVQETYALADTLPTASEQHLSELAAQLPALRALRDAITAAKTTWNKCASGHRPSLQAFVEQSALLQRHAEALQQPSMLLLAARLAEMAQWLGAQPERIDDIVAMETATGLLLLESGAENFARLGVEFDEQAQHMAERLRACIEGKALGAAAPVPVLDEMSRRAQERLLMGQVVAEIQASLRAIEQALDEFFRDSSKRASLSDLARPVRQVLGAFTMLGEERAAAALSACFADVQRFAQPGYEPSHSDFERVAGALSGLGFYVDALQYGKADLERFMNPIGTPVAHEPAADEAAAEATVEDEIETAKGELERDFEAWRRQPEDAQVRDAFQRRLAAVQKDANLVANAALEQRIGEMLALLKAETARPFDAEISQVMQNIVPATAIAPPSPEAAKLLSASNETVDAELLAVYLEEAGEVLGTIAAHLVLVHEQPQDMDVLRTIRRGYHTLKGSGRMVGLTRSSEAAWAIEQVMNRWLEEERAATPDLLALIEAGRAYFADAVAVLKDGGVTPDETAIVALAEKVRRGEPLTATDLAAAEPGAQAVPQTAAAQAVDAAPTSVGAAAPSLDFTQPIEPLSVEFDALGVPADDTIHIGETALSESLFRVFVEEAHTLLATLKAAHASPLPSAFDEDFRRSLHTLTGIAGTARFAAVRALSEHLERLAGRLGERRPDDAVRAGMGEALDALQSMIDAIAQREPPQPADELLARLNALGHAEDGVSSERVDDAAPVAEVVADDTADDPVELDFSALAPAGEQPDEFAESGGSIDDSAAVAQASDAVVPDESAETARVAEPAAFAAESGSTAERRQARLDDDLDAQLLPIFLEEAQELMPAVGGALRDWRDHPTNEAAGHALQRVLHTLKGSARMAGAMAMGELTHAMETRVENALALSTLPITLFDALDGAYDRLNALYERLQHPEAVAPVAATPEPTGAGEGEASEVIEAAAATPGMDELEAAAQQRAVLRVRADVIDRLVNEAGEVSIARSRIEGEMRALKAAVQDLTENVGRLRTQLREIEIQAESQMQSKMSLAQEQHAQFDPLEFDRFTRFQELTRGMAESVNDVSTVQNNLLVALDESDAALSAQARMTRDLQAGLMGIRMVPFSSVSERLYRVVRQAARETGKRAVLDIHGSQVELDRSVLERITAPFEHMLRNSVAHGIEDAAQRVAAGKPPVGEVKVVVRQEGNEVMLTVSDDGGGLDFAGIRAKAEALGLLAPEAVVDDAGLAEFIFNAGFSTAAEVTQLAGRGVGMDVVKSEISALGGRIDTESEPERGTRFTIYLPLTTAVTQAVLVRAGGRTYAVPSVMVEQIRQLKTDELARCHATGQIDWQGRGCTLRYLPRLLGDDAWRPESQRITPVMLARSGTTVVAVQIDEVLGNREIVVKNTGPLLARVLGITGATVLGTGEIVLILNPVVLSQNERVSSLGAMQATTERAPEPQTPTVPTVMIVDDSLTVRKITGRLLAREGYNVLTAKDGVDAMEQLQAARPDVMLVDIEMPRMDGFDLTRNVRADGALKHIPIIMITSRTAEKHRNYAAQVGVNVYLGKPFQEDQLLEHIAGFVRRPIPA